MPLAILHMEGLHGTADICAQYNPHYSSIPKTLKGTVSFEFRCFMQIIQMGLDFFTSLNFYSLRFPYFPYLPSLPQFKRTLQPSFLPYHLCVQSTSNLSFNCKCNIHLLFVIGQLLHIFCNFEKMQVQQILGINQAFMMNFMIYDIC